MEEKVIKKEVCLAVTPEDIIITRSKLGKTQSEFGQLLNVSAKTIQLWETGKTSPQKSKIPILLKLKEGEKGIIQNVNGVNAKGTQIIGDGCSLLEQEKRDTDHTKTLLDSHISLMQQMQELTKTIVSQQETILKMQHMQELTKVIASQQETISQLMAINSNK